MMTRTRWIWVTFDKVGFHYYPAAATRTDLADVSYLANRHRHKFGFKIQIEIYHDDRELEFHQFKNFCESLFDTSIIDINSKSVEMLADDVYEQINEAYPRRNVIIEVDEDGENGCKIEYFTNLH